MSGAACAAVITETNALIAELDALNAWMEQEMTGAIQIPHPSAQIADLREAIAKAREKVATKFAALQATAT